MSFKLNPDVSKYLSAISRPVERLDPSSLMDPTAENPENNSNHTEWSALDQRKEQQHKEDVPAQPTSHSSDEADEIDVEWPENEAHRLMRLEAVLFLAREPLNSRKLSELASLEDGTQARTLVKRLNEKYDQVGRAFHVKQVAGGFQMMTRPQFAGWLRRLDGDTAGVRLTTPAMETLAVVAYRQPVLKAEIEAIRGVSCGELLRQLMERNLVKISGRSPELGNPYLYATTKRFLEVFGLANLDALPRADKLRGQGIPDPANEMRETTSSPADPPESSDSPDVTNEEGSP